MDSHAAYDRMANITVIPMVPIHRVPWRHYGTASKGLQLSDFMGNGHFRMAYWRYQLGVVRK